MNILILAAGNAVADGRKHEYPLCLTELDGQPLIERLINAFASFGPHQIIIALNNDEVRKFHLQNIVELLAPGTIVLRIANKTRGAACTALLAAANIDNSKELLVINGDSLLDVKFDEVIQQFRDRDLDAGTIVFPSVHPRYSYVRLNNELVVEAAEKNPISRNATAGFYWYARGSEFVGAIKNMIRKDAHVDGNFFICPAFNELVLQQRKIGVFHIDLKQYHQLKTERQLDNYEAKLDQGRN
jgi:dTDP-glucose pyrophosphorylase